VRIEQPVDQRRNQHASQRGHYRKGGILQRGKLPGNDLPFQLQPHQQEKQRHEAVVHALVKSELEVKGPDARPNRLLPQVEKAFPPSRIGDDQGNDGSADKDDPAGRGSSQKPLEGAEDSSEKRLKGVLPDPVGIIACFVHRFASCYGKYGWRCESSPPDMNRFPSLLPNNAADRIICDKRRVLYW